MTTPENRYWYRYAGTDRHGNGRYGIRDCTAAEMATEVEIRYRQGWRELTVVRGSGPVPPDRDEWNVAGIGPRPDGRRGRIWWAET